ncbi:MAG: SpoIIE family protein phosphatase [Limnobacter sp.]|nr:SpoIIE family protein phosphatase [Limnobacter sp.]
MSDPLLLSSCEALCRSLGYQVLTIESAEQALIRMSHRKAQIVISDWNVQQGKGTDLCQSIRQNKLGIYTYFIAVTSSAAESDLRGAIDIQVDELISTPISRDRLQLSLIQAHRALELQQSLTELNETLPETQHSLERDLFLLRQLQISLQPRDQQLVDGVKVHLYSQALGLLSGVQCSVFKVRPNKVGFIVTDVKHRGIPGAIRAMGFARLFSNNPIESVIFKMRGSGSEPLELRTCDEVFSILNTVYQVGEDDLAAVTALYGIFDSQTKTIEISLAGMPSPYLIRRSGQVTQVGMIETPLGLSKNYRYGSTRLSVDEGDSLLLYSEGLTHVLNPEGLSLPFKLLDKTIRDWSPMGFERLRGGLMQTILSWSQKPQHHVFSDDVMVLGLDFFHDASTIQPDSTQNISGIQVQSAALIAPPEVSDTVASQNNLKGFLRRALLICDGQEPLDELLIQMGYLGIECEFTSVHGGHEHIDLVPHDFDLVLIEGDHPFELTLSWLEFIKKSLADSSPYVIVCHPSKASHLSTELIEAGAHKLVEFPCAPLELQFHLETASRHIQLKRSVDLKAAQLARIRAEMEVEMDMVAKMQLRTMPKRIPELPQLVSRWIYRAAKRVSGDFMGVFQITPAVAGFFVLDGDREGVLGAVKAWALARLLRGVDPFQSPDQSAADGMSGLKSLNSPAQILKELNQIVSNLPVGYRLDCSMVFGTLDCQTGQGVLSNAGNPPVYLSRPDGSHEEMGKVSPHIGQSAATRFEDLTFQMSPGDRLYVYTDGLTQLLNQNATEGALSVSMLQLLEANSFKPANRVKLDLESLIEKVTRHAKPKDVSLLMLELEEIREIEMRDVGVIEWIDRYQPMMIGLSGSMQFPLFAKVFETILSDFSGPELVAKVTDFLTDKSLYSEQVCTRCQMVLNELVCKVERKSSNPTSNPNLMVVLIMHPNELGLILIDNGRAIVSTVDDALKQTLDGVANSVDEFRLARHHEENQMVVMLKGGH